MRLLLRGADVFLKKGFSKCDIAIDNGRIISLEPKIDGAFDETIDAEGFNIFPGFIDVHTHLREPGFFYKETIESGTRAAARGGYTAVFSMPNLNPCPDTLENLKVQTDIIERDAQIKVIPYGTITKGERGEELSDMEALSPFVIGFSDDGRGVQSADIMEKAMFKAASLKKIIVAHCEDNTLLHGGYIHDGEYAKRNGHKGICSESEWGQIARDIEIVKKTGCRYHVCHISTKESVDIIRKAKAEGVNVTCETAPHYLCLDESKLQEDGRFKMNPPLRAKADRLALIEGLKDGTIDAIATDHAPHSYEEKSKGLKGSLMGVVGLETAFAVLYTNLVKTGLVPIERIIDALSYRPAEIFGLTGGIEKGNFACLNAFDLRREYEIDSSEFLSKGKSSPFNGNKVFGRCMFTIYKGRIVWRESEKK